MLALNLIPPQLKSDLHAADVIQRWMWAIGLLAGLLTLGTVGLLSADRMLASHADRIHTDLIALQQRQIQNAGSDITSTTSNLNSTIKTLTATLGQPDHWAQQTTLVLAALPSGVTVNSLDLTPTGKFHLIGEADTRQTFLTLQQSLTTNHDLGQVKTSSTASKRSAVPFDFTGQVIKTNKP